MSRKTQLESDLTKAYERIRLRKNWCQGSAGSFDEDRGVMRECTTRAVDVATGFGFKRRTDRAWHRKWRCIEALWDAAPIRVKRKWVTLLKDQYLDTSDKEIGLQDINDHSTHRTVTAMFRRAIRMERNRRYIRDLEEGGSRPVVVEDDKPAIGQYEEAL